MNTWMAQFLTLILCFHGLTAGAETPPIRLGALQTTVENAAASRAAGLDLAMLEVSWDRFEPERGKFSQDYIEVLRGEAEAFRRAGLELVLDFGVQYPPKWLLELPDARYRNQFGDEYRGRGPGKEVANSVFNEEVRKCQAAYMRQVFKELGTKFYAVRLGGGWYSELTYPEDKFGGRVNCYWGFDDLAQGRKPGLPKGVEPCPYPGWKPGDTGGEPASARLFLAWYLDSLRNYLHWQIEVARLDYDGTLMLLFPSWGVREGESEKAVMGNLAGNTSAEKNGEVARGVDFGYLTWKLGDGRLMLHCTWLDADPSFGEPPIAYLAKLAAKSYPPLPVSGENTGGGGQPVMDLCAARAKEYGLRSFLWAFEKDLFDGQAPEVGELGKAFQP
jgi:hypothetical protein